MSTIVIPYRRTPPAALNHIIPKIHALRPAHRTAQAHPHSHPVLAVERPARDVLHARVVPHAAADRVHAVLWRIGPGGR